MGRKSLKEVRQQEIILAFYKLAKKEGIENTSIAKIAKAMDVNPSLIIHYFQTKEELSYALIEFILDRYTPIFEVTNKSAKTAREILLAVIDNLFSKQWNKLFDDGLFYSCYALSFRDEKIKNRYHSLLSSLRAKLTEIIEAANQDGSLSIERPSECADLIFIILDGAYFYLSLSKDPILTKSKLALYKEKALKVLEI
ncbi:transcriptional regulator, TetR family [Dyadobacter koreensis]|uniref:Biofilm operon icaADBC HTH-type negative transcriptional regulator IcaR n=1 Tax=Dyadobacter koreensis TaxID=408657 RepID=A0A1H6QAX1_9BACT|nr:TetR family transcriptional regulator [Dyadobacter koreensis]SEI40918.1 transcriptional regulator, TetR family [Dyadobacter koreensis]